ncbi:MAG: DnaA regulatory inactivator Hda [Pseudomonadota bacterium]|nr:MAG: DnaA regulatory inactivator Hda [Pseudomonadota bacterium]
MSQQLALNVRLRDASSLENFIPGRNRELVESLRVALNALARDGHSAQPVVYLWGESGSGRSHLLEGACRAVDESQRRAAYVPLDQGPPLSPALLEDRETAALVCLDNLDAVAGGEDWERALFALTERLRAAGGMLLVAASRPPRDLGLCLADLASRLAWGPIYHVQALDDDGKLEALRVRAMRRGLTLPDEVARYILSRQPRDVHSLFALLERLDQSSLREQRRLTIPFVRSLGI